MYQALIIVFILCYRYRVKTFNEMNQLPSPSTNNRGSMSFAISLAMALEIDSFFLLAYNTRKGATAIKQGSIHQ